MKTTLVRLINFLEKLESEGDEVEMLKYSQGVLSTKGCDGDYGCCSKQLDIIGTLDDLKELLKTIK